MCLTKFLFKTAENGVFTTLEEQTTLTTLRGMKARAGLLVPLYESAEHEVFELSVDESGCVEISTVQPTNEVAPQAALPILLFEVAKTDEPELENHSILCKLMRTQAGRNFIAGRGEDPGSHLMKTWQLKPKQGSE